MIPQKGQPADYSLPPPTPPVKGGGLPAPIFLNAGDFYFAAAPLKLATLLRQRGIPLPVEHVGGAGHRNLIFDLTTGEVQMPFVDMTKEPDRG